MALPSVCSLCYHHTSAKAYVWQRKHVQHFYLLLSIFCEHFLNGKSHHFHLLWHEYHCINKKKKIFFIPFYPVLIFPSHSLIIPLASFLLQFPLAIALDDNCVSLCLISSATDGTLSTLTDVFPLKVNHEFITAAQRAPLKRSCVNGLNRVDIIYVSCHCCTYTKSALYAAIDLCIKLPSRIFWEVL